MGEGRGYTVAVVGATGAVGLEMLAVLERRAFPVRGLRLLASERSAGKRLRFRGEEVPIEALRDDEALAGTEVALLSAGSTTSRRFARRWAEGALVIDNSSAFRMEPDVPLCVPEINPDAARGRRAGLVANPNCTTAIALMALAPLHRLSPLVRVTAASYQAASGAGAQAMAELEDQARAWSHGAPPAVRVFPRQLLWNAIPQVDVFLDDGYTKEEMKLLHESRKILSHPALLCSATCVRVPALRAHAVALHVEAERPISPSEARAAIAAARGVRVVDAPRDADAARRYPTQLDAAGQDDVLVGRIREDASHPGGLALWAVGDQLLKGAALNAVQLAELGLGLPMPSGAAW